MNPVYRIHVAGNDKKKMFTIDCESQRVQFEIKNTFSFSNIKIPFISRLSQHRPTIDLIIKYKYFLTYQSADLSICSFNQFFSFFRFFFVIFFVFIMSSVRFSDPGPVAIMLRKSKYNLILNKSVEKKSDLWSIFYFFEKHCRKKNWFNRDFCRFHEKKSNNFRFFQCLFLHSEQFFLCSSSLRVTSHNWRQKENGLE